MSRGPWQTTLIVAVLLVASVALTGCPKRPLPGPGVAAESGTAGGASGTAGTVTGTTPGVGGAGTGTIGQSPTTGGTTIPAGPAPSEFSETGRLADVHFDFDRAEIRPSDKDVLASNVKWLKANTRSLLLIEGHCDERGTSEYNLALGQRRANAARDYLVASGIDAKRISLISYGKERPLCSERNEGCWGQNRRAHFLIKP